MSSISISVARLRRFSIKDSWVSRVWIFSTLMAALLARGRNCSSSWTCFLEVASS